MISIQQYWTLASFCASGIKGRVSLSVFLPSPQHEEQQLKQENEIAKVPRVQQVGCGERGNPPSALWPSCSFSGRLLWWSFYSLFFVASLLSSWQLLGGGGRVLENMGPLLPFLTQGFKFTTASSISCFKVWACCWNTRQLPHWSKMLWRATYGHSRNDSRLSNHWMSITGTGSFQCNPKQSQTLLHPLTSMVLEDCNSS